MTIIVVESSLESSGRGGIGGGAGSGDGGSSFSTNFGSSFSGSASSSRGLPAGEERPPPIGVVGESGSSRQSPDYGGDKISNDILLFLLKGGVTVDPVALVPVGSLPEVGGYEWAGHDVSAQVSYYHSRMRL